MKIATLEADAVLRKVSGVSPALVAQKIAQFAAGPITVVAVDAALALSAMITANSLVSQAFWNQTGAGSHLP